MGIFDIFTIESIVELREIMPTKLPIMLRPFFWDYEFNMLSWKKDRDLIIGRILSSGDWGAIKWLRSHMGDRSLKKWLECHEGDGLSPQQLRFWELILGIPHDQVNTWLAAERRKVWEKRTNSKRTIQKS